MGPSVESALAAYRTPAPRSVAHALGFDDEAIDEAVGRGLVVEDDRLRVNPVLVAPTAPGTEHRTALDDVLSQVVPDDPLWSEAFRLDHALGRGPDPDRVRRFAEVAILRGTAREATSAWIDFGLVPTLVGIARGPVLRLLVEAGRLADIEPLLDTGDETVRARAAVVAGHPDDALQLLGDRGDPEARRIRARALLNLGRSRDADDALPDEVPARGLARVEHRELAWLTAIEVGRPVVWGDASDDPWERLNETLVRARIALRLGHLREARAALDALRDQLQIRPAPRVRATAEFVGALVAFYTGNHELLEAQLRRLEDLGFLTSSTVWQHARAVLALSASDWETAAELANEIAESNPYGVANMQAWIAIRSGDPDAALARLADAPGDSVLYQQEVAWLRRLARKRRGDEVSANTTPSSCVTIRIVDLLLDGEIALDEGRTDDARALADEARALVREHGAGVRAPDVHLLRADIAARVGDLERATVELGAAEAHLPHPSNPAAEIIALARRRLAGEAASDRRFVPPDRDTLRVASDGSWFQQDDRVELGRKKIARRLLIALLDARLEDRWLSLEELVEAGWPEERILPSAAANRLHVALNGLRSLGLSVASGPDGWSLDPELRVIRVAV